MHKLTQWAAVMATALVSTSQAQVLIEEKTTEPVKVLSELDQRRAEVYQWYLQRREYNPNEFTEVIYGADDRRDVYQVTDQALLDFAQAACVVVNRSELVNNGNGTYTLNTRVWTSQGGTLCADEPFRGQRQIGFCSGFLLGTDLIGTAGHCVRASDIPNVAFVFGFDQRGPNLDPFLTVPADNVYFASQLVTWQLSSGFDHSLVRIDRPVQGWRPMPIRRSGEVSLNDPLVMIGHPVVLPKKIDAGGVCKDPRPGQPWFSANVDAYGGNSGSMVVNLNTGLIEGILVRGNPDFTSSGGCVRSNVCPDSGCPTWEELSKIAPFIPHVPPLGLLVSPGGAQTHVGVVGGPFDNIPFMYTLSNPTDSSLNYRVTISGSAPFLINGATDPVLGSIGGGGSANVHVTLAGSASGFPAGIYSATIIFEDLTAGRSEERMHILEVGQTAFEVTPDTGLTTGGPVGGPFNATQAYTITSTRPTPVLVQVAPTQNWIAVDGSAAPLSFTLNGLGDARTVTVGMSSAANGLLNGLYNGSVLISNMTGGQGDTTRTVQLDVGRYTFPSTDTPLPITDHTTINSFITVPEAVCITDVDVEINITHTYRGDLIVELTSPMGTTVRLHNRTGGSADDIVGTYDDSSFPPDGPGMLADFNGQMAAGVWRLMVSDNASADQGTLNAWALKIAGGTNCPPVAFDDYVEVAPNVPSMLTLDGASSQSSYDFVIMSLPSHGTLADPAGGTIVSVPYTVLSGGAAVRYQPGPGFVGDDAFTFAVYDGQWSNTATLDIQVGQTTVVYDFPMDTNPGWTLTGMWAFGVPLGQGSNNRDPTSGYTGQNVLGYNLAGDYTNNMPPTPATTTALDLTGVAGTRLRFARWLAIESARWDHASVEVSNNGVSWTRIWDWETMTSVSPTSWTIVEYDIAHIADNQPTVYIRWVMGPTDSSVTYPGWNIDDVQILGILPPGQSCVADMSSSSDPFDPGYGVPDGQVDAADFFYFLDQFVLGNIAVADLTGSSDPFDPNYGVPDGQVDAADFFYFLDRFVDGCP
ncbi:MAG: proprotein convertase P-domain-containing protein [Phycisphaeraceae bacterium]|nr:proprotein convertase P-domain-containing protein [Phycisphaeraceae bacterium]